MTDIPDDVVERALSATTPECHEGLQYVLIRGLHAMGFNLPASESRELARAALRVAVEWERERCAMVADEYTHGNEDEYDYADIGKVVAAKNIAAAIRSRKDQTT